MSVNPRLSVITPAFNQADYLPETIESVLSQDFADMEYIVLNDGSTDDTLAVLARYDDRVNVVTHSNMGEIRTVNRGLSMARGDFIAIINADDPLRPGTFSAIIEAMEAEPKVLVGYPDWDEIDAVGNTRRTLSLPLYDPDKMLLEQNVAMGPGAIMRRRAYELAGPRDVSKRFNVDVMHWFTMALHGSFVHIPRALATHRVHDEAASSAAKGWQFGWEYSRFAYDALANPLTPKHLSTKRNFILAKAHRQARQYCGENTAARMYHKAMRTWYRALQLGVAR